MSKTKVVVELFKWIKSGDLKKVEAFLQSNVKQHSNFSLNVCNGIAGTPLCAAISAGNPDVALLLIEYGVKCDQDDYDTEAPVFLALRKKQWVVVEALVRNNCNLNIRDTVTRQPLMHAVICSDQYQIFQDMIPRNCNLRMTDNEGNSVLHAACMVENTKYLEKLLFEDLQKNLCNNDGLTALHIAVKFNKVDHLKFLIRNWNVNHKFWPQGDLMPCCNINAGDGCFKRSALHYAVGLENKAICDILVNSGCDVNRVDVLGQSPLLLACSKKLHDIATLLVSAQANVNCIAKIMVHCEMGVEYMTTSALHLAAMSGDIELLQVLLKSKTADINIQDERGRSVLFHAVVYEQPAMVRFLLENAQPLGLDVTQRTTEGCTPLHAAPGHVSSDVTRCLLQAGLSVTDVNSKGGTPLHRAVEAEDLDNIRVLLESGAFSTDAPMPTENFRTVLQRPLLCEALEAVKPAALLAQLIAYGADPLQQPLDGCALLQAAEEGRSSEVDLFVAGLHPQHFAVSQLRRACIKNNELLQKTLDRQLVEVRSLRHLAAAEVRHTFRPRLAALSSVLPRSLFGYVMFEPWVAAYTGVDTSSDDFSSAYDSSEQSDGS